MTMASDGRSLHEITSNPNLNFLNIMHKDDDDLFSDSPYDTSTFSTSYVDPLEYIRSPSINNTISFMSFNIQSISSKLNDFQELITFFDDNNFSPNIICLQELWQFSPHLNTTLGGYHPLLFKLRNNTQGGGVGIYVKSDILVKQLPEFSVFADRILETIFVEITLPNNTKYTIGSIYSPGATHPTLTPLELFNEFNEIFNNLLDSLCNVPNLILLGDLNLDALLYHENPRVQTYIDSLFSYGLLQLVCKPTRCNDNSATLIDHALTNVKSPIYSISILTSRISDHFPVEIYRSSFSMESYSLL